MHTLNRRHWLRLVGLAGAATAAPALAAAIPDFSAPLPRPFDSDTPARLGLNENPYGPSSLVREAMVRAFDDACRYPSAYTKDITQLIAEKEGVKPEHIVLTAGSSEGLKAAGLAFGMHGGEIVSPDPTFHILMNY
ncbi:MAG: aminotransferase, partial [Haliscomenobacter sp.]